MALFPMTFPFYFDEVPAPVYTPFRPLADESLRSFGTITEDSRIFLDPSFVHRQPQVEIVREFDGTFDGRIFGVTVEDNRGSEVSGGVVTWRYIGTACGRKRYSVVEKS